MTNMIPKIAEYLAMACTLKEGSSEENYQKTNALVFELAMTLPPELYSEVVMAIVPGDKRNIFTAIAAVRKHSKEEYLSPDLMAIHAPGIGTKQWPTS